MRELPHRSYAYVGRLPDTRARLRVGTSASRDCWERSETRAVRRARRRYRKQWQIGSDRFVRRRPQHSTWYRQRPAGRRRMLLQQRARARLVRRAAFACQQNAFGHRAVKITHCNINFTFNDNFYFSHSTQHRITTLKSHRSFFLLFDFALSLNVWRNWL